MLLRFLTFVLLLLAGTLAGALWQPWWSSWQGATLGAIASATLWVLLDMLRGHRTLNWLLRGQLDPLPTSWGLWGELADRIRRLSRRQMQEIARSDQRLAQMTSAIQASPNGVLLLDSQDCIEWCNQTAAQHLGLDTQRDQQQLITHLVRDPVFNAYLHASDNSRETVIEGRLNRPGASQRLSVQWFPYGEGRRLLLTRDITAIEQAETMRRDFVANVSHEIRTPLTVLSGFVETLQSLPLTEPEKQRYLEMMSDQARRMQTLVADLLTLSRLEGSPLPGVSEWTPMSVLWQACASDARALAGATHDGSTLTHELRLEPPAELHSHAVAGSRNELQSAMSNLISNALRYTPAGGTVTIGWQWQRPQGVEFWVQDNGPGIAPEHLPRLTERFYRVDRSRSRETGGTGLGLAIVKHVVQRHGGHMKISSVPGQGSRFGFVLPLDRFDLIDKLPSA